jgi:hypothetical protein
MTARVVVHRCDRCRREKPLKEFRRSPATGLPYPDCQRCISKRKPAMKDSEIRRRSK